MAFGYNAAYGQPYYPQPPMMDNLAQMRAQQQPMQQQSQGMIWVQGEAAGKSYLVAPGNTVPLWDSERQTIYLKSVDNAGIPTMRILDYTERAQSTPAQPTADYVTRAEYEALVKQVAALMPKEVSNE